jgi:hypothetical protein
MVRYNPDIVWDSYISPLLCQRFRENPTYPTYLPEVSLISYIFDEVSRISYKSPYIFDEVSRISYIFDEVSLKSYIFDEVSLKSYIFDEVSLKSRFHTPEIA